MGEIHKLVLQARAIDVCLQQRHRAFAELVVRFQDMAYACAFSRLGDVHLAQDAAQEAFLAAYRELGKLRQPKAFPGWLRRIVLTQCNRMTRNKRLPTWPIDDAVGVPCTRPNPATLTEEREMRDHLLAAVRALPEHERIVTSLFYLSGYSQKEIAEFLEIPLTTVKKRLQYARERLTERMFDMARESLQEDRPSRDERFARRLRLRQAMEAGNTRGVADLIAEDPSLMRETCTCPVAWSERPLEGATPLHLAADYGHREVVAALLFHGSDANAKDRFARTPLHCAAAGSARVEVAELLLKSGADVNAEDHEGVTPLRLAARCSFPTAEAWADHWGMAEFLLSKGAKPDLFVAAALDKNGMAGVLLEDDPNRLNLPNAAGETPLHWAAGAGYRQTAKALLDAGADLHARDNKGRTPLHWAVQPGVHRRCAPTPVARLLIERGAVVDILAASVLGDRARMDALLGIDPDLVHTRDHSGATSLCLAAWHGHTDVVEVLLAHGADVSEKDQDGRTALSVRYDVEDYSRNIAQVLLSNGAKPDLTAALTLGMRDAAQT